MQMIKSFKHLIDATKQEKQTVQTNKKLKKKAKGNELKQKYTVSTHDDVLCNLFISIIFLNEEMNDSASDENRSEYVHRTMEKESEMD